MILGVIIAIIGFAMGIGFLGAFIQDKLGGQSMIYLLVVLVVASLIYLIKSPKKSRRNNSELLRVGTLIFQNHKEEFVSFYNLYLHDKKKFLVQKEMEEFDLENLRPIDVLYIFGASKNLVHLIDWRGEEYEEDIETYIEDHLLKQKHTWTNASKLRLGVDEQKQRNGKFIVDLFKSVDNDLQAINQRILFFDLGSDAYAYTTLDSKTFDEIILNAPDSFHGTNKLRK
jgi:hypothetical protein